MTDVLCLHKRQENVVVLLALELVDCGDLFGVADERVVGASLAQHVSDEVLLAVVGGQDRDLLARIADQAHVHEECNDVLGLGKVLVEVRLRLGLALAIVVVDVD